MQFLGLVNQRLKNMLMNFSQQIEIQMELFLYKILLNICLILTNFKINKKSNIFSMVYLYHIEIILAIVNTQLVSLVIVRLLIIQKKEKQSLNKKINSIKDLLLIVCFQQYLMTKIMIFNLFPIMLLKNSFTLQIKIKMVLLKNKTLWIFLKVVLYQIFSQ